MMFILAPHGGRAEAPELAAKMSFVSPFATWLGR
jgi:phage replication-related protein YjqB (UPF0714/DUF867 family)